jgi:hypothetical protein
VITVHDPGAGSFTYKLQIRSVGGGTVSVTNIKIHAVEIAL